MFGDIESPSKNLTIGIRFDVLAYRADPNRCIRFEIKDDQNNGIHVRNDFSKATDEELSIGITMMRAVSSFLEKEEFDRFEFKGKAAPEHMPNEIDKLIQNLDKKES